MKTWFIVLILILAYFPIKAQLTINYEKIADADSYLSNQNYKKAEPIYDAAVKTNS